MTEVLPEPQSKAQTRRQQILDAACECVRRAGFHGASMAEIAATAGLSVGQIYRYFESKEAIVAAIVGQDLAEMHAKFAEFGRQDAPLIDTVIEVCGHAIDRQYDPERASLVLEVMAEAARNPRVAAIVREADVAERQVVRKLLDEACGQGCSDAEKAARGEVISMIFDGMVSRAVNNPQTDRAAIGKVVKTVVRLLLSPAALN